MGGSLLFFTSDGGAELNNSQVVFGVEAGKGSVTKVRLMSYDDVSKHLSSTVHYQSNEARDNMASTAQCKLFDF